MQTDRDKQIQALQEANRVSNVLGLTDCQKNILCEFHGSFSLEVLFGMKL